MAVTQSQQAAKDTIVFQALSLLLKDEVASDFAKQARQDPVGAMVMACTFALKEVKKAAAQAGRNDVGEPMFMVAAAKDILVKLSEMLVVFGIIKQQDVAKMLPAAHQEIVQVVKGN